MIPARHFPAIRESLAALLLAALPLEVHAANIYLHPNYQSTPVTLPFTYSGGGIAADPNDQDTFWIFAGFFQIHELYRVTFDENGAVLEAKRMADGTTDVTGDTLCDDHFGDPHAVPLPNGDVLIADADRGSNGAFVGTLGETILRARDTNSNGDFLREGEITQLVNPHGFSGPNFTGGKGTLGPDARVYVGTNDTGGSAEVLVFQQNGTGLTRFAGGLDRVHGLGFLPDGRLAIGHIDSPFLAGSVLLAQDTTGDQLAMAPGEVSTLLSGLPPVRHLATAGGAIFISTSDPGVDALIERVDASSGARETILSVTPTIGAFNNYFPVFAFDSSTRPFEPAINPRRLLVFDFSTGLQLIKPVQGAAVDSWLIY